MNAISFLMRYRKPVIWAYLVAFCLVCHGLAVALVLFFFWQ